MAKQKKWMQKVVSDPNFKAGSFRAWCKRQGYSKTTCACVAKGKASKNAAIRKKATLAGVFLKCGKSK